MFKRLGLAGALVAALSLVTPLAHAAPQGQATPPTPDQLRQTTTSMLQPSDVPSALAGSGAQNIGYYIPTGGQDPYPVCGTPTGKSALPDLTMTIGYFSEIGDISQQLIVYPSNEAATTAWEALARKIARSCSYSAKIDGVSTTVTNGALNSNGALWTRRDSQSPNYGSEYSGVGLVGDAIIILRVENPKKVSTTAAQRASIESLVPLMMQRYLNKDNGGGVQSTLLSIAETAMVTPDDMPSTLPINTPEEGSWSLFTADLPGTVPFNPCYPGDSDILPAGTGSFSADYGGTGDIQYTGAAVMQQVFTYADESAADAAWKQLSRRITECNDRAGKLYSKTGSAWKSRTGTSAVVVDGTPGIYVRYITTQGNQDKDNRFTERNYRLMLKSGSVISWLTYDTGVAGIRKLTINEPAVNQLAVELIDRYVNTVVTTN